MVGVAVANGHVLNHRSKTLTTVEVEAAVVLVRTALAVDHALACVSAGREDDDGLAEKVEIPIAIPNESTVAQCD